MLRKLPQQASVDAEADPAAYLDCRQAEVSHIPEKQGKSELDIEMTIFVFEKQIADYHTPDVSELVGWRGVNYKI